jgi:hypothetical protein
MNITSHETILAALKNQASWYSNRDSTREINDSVIHWALDKTGTIDTSFLFNSNENTKQIALVGQQERNRVMEIGGPEKVLWIHGVAPASKPEGVIRLIYENVNGISNRLSNNNKVKKAKEIIDELEVDIVAYKEHHLKICKIGKMWMVSTGCSRGEKQPAFNLWWSTTSTRILEGCRKKGQTLLS